VGDRVEAFLKSLAPEPRRALVRAMKGLKNSEGDLKPLEGKLAGFSRLRVGAYRVIYVEECASGERVIRCVFAERRAVVYSIFEKILAQQLIGLIRPA